MARKKLGYDEDIDERIMMEIIVDAHGPEEQAMGWYYYLEDELQFPFEAVCSSKRAISPLHIKDKVEVIGMGPEEECEKEMFVTIHWDKDYLAIPLSQLTPIDEMKAQNSKAVEDWHYWVQMGYQFG